MVVSQYLMLVLLLLTAGLAGAQQTPDFTSGGPAQGSSFSRPIGSAIESRLPEKITRPRVDWALRISQVAFAAGQAADLATTVQAVNGGHAVEGNRWLTSDPHQVGGRFYGIKTGMTLSVLGGGEWAARRYPGSRKAVILTNLGLAAASFAVAGHNFSLRVK